MTNKPIKILGLQRTNSGDWDVIVVTDTDQFDPPLFFLTVNDKGDILKEKQGRGP